MLREHVTGDSGEKPVIVVVYASGTVVGGPRQAFHDILGAAVEPVVFAEFAGDKPVNDRDDVVALPCNHYQFSCDRASMSTTILII